MTAAVGSFAFILEDNLLAYRDLILSYGRAAMSFPKSTVISSGGVPSPYIYFLLEGLVRISVFGPQGYERILGYHKKNTLFAMDGLRRDQGVIVTTTALTQVEAVRLSLEDLSVLFQQDPRFAADVVLYYSDVLKLMCYDAESQSSNDTRAKLANFILLFMQCADYQTLGYIPFSQSELASAIGASRIQVARVCRTLKAEGLIQVGKRRLMVLDPERLGQSVSYQGFP